MNTLSPQLLIDVIENKRFGVEYQPIIDLNNQEIFAYEALSRFYDDSNKSIPPDAFFMALHNSPISLFQVEYDQKVLQLSSSPDCERLFINVDQDSYFASGITGINNPFLQLFKNHVQQSVTVELIENSEINDAKMSLEMIEILSNNNINTAIDDVFGPLSMLSFEVIQLVEFIKLDKSVVSKRGDKEFISLVKAIVEYARTSGKRTILEGVENKEDLRFATEINVNYVQGFLYKKKFVQVS